MKLELLVCDICSKTPKNERIRMHELKLICSLPCWLEYWKHEWQRWRDQEDSKKDNKEVVKSKQFRVY